MQNRLPNGKEAGIVNAVGTQREDMTTMLANHKWKIWENDGIWYTYLPDATKKRRLITRHTKEDLVQTVTAFYRNRITLTELFEEWSEDKLRYGEIQKQTFDRYKTDFERFITPTMLSAMDVRDITEDMLEVFIRSTIHDKGLTAKAWGNLRTLLRGAFKLAHKRGLISFSFEVFLSELNLSRKVFERHIRLDEEQVFTDSEVARIEEYILAHPTRAGYGVLFAFETGLRCGELSVLKPTDVKNGILRVSKTEVRYKDADGHYMWSVRESTKGRDGVRSVILTDKGLWLWNVLKTDDEWLFMRDGKRIKGQAFSRRLRAVCSYLGITERSLHKARKTYATRLLNAGIDEKLVEKQMGHTTIATTKGYYYFNNRDIEEARRLLSKASEGGHAPF